MPEETFWSESTDPHGVAPGELTQPQPAVTPEDPAPEPRPRGTSPEAGRSHARDAESGHSRSNGRHAEAAHPYADDRHAEAGDLLADDRGSDSGGRRSGERGSEGVHPYFGSAAADAARSNGRRSEAGHAFSRGRHTDDGRPVGDGRDTERSLFQSRSSETAGGRSSGTRRSSADGRPTELGQPEANGRAAEAGRPPANGRTAETRRSAAEGRANGRGDDPGRLVAGGRRGEAGQPVSRDRRAEGGAQRSPAHGRSPAQVQEAAQPAARHAGQATAGGQQRGGAQDAAAGTGTRTQDRPEPQRQAGPPKRKRDPFLDNVKFILITLVPIGHSLVPTLAADSARAAYIFIYTFHMPLFVVISGFLSRNFWNSNAKTNKLVDTFLIPYVIVEVGYAALRFALGQKWSLTIIDPAWLNWYLLALLFWRLSTPVWKRMRYPVPVAIAIYLFAGFSQISGDFSMDRFFGLLPFFVIGLVLQPEHFDMLNRTWIKVVAVFTILSAAAVAILIAPKAPLGPFYYKNSYQDLHVSWWMGLGVRTGLLICALAMCFAILALVPRKETWYTDLGTRTLYCYLLHGVPVLIAKQMGWLSVPWLYGPLGVLAIASGGFLLSIILCLPQTRTLFKWMLEPRLTWLYRRPSRS